MISRLERIDSIVTGKIDDTVFLGEASFVVNIHLTMVPIFPRMGHRVQLGLHNRESRENRERSRLCNQGRTLQNATARQKSCGKVQSVG